MTLRGRGKYLALAAAGLIAAIVIGNTRNQTESSQEETPQGRAGAEAGTAREVTFRIDYPDDCSPTRDEGFYCYFAELDPIPAGYPRSDWEQHIVYSALPEGETTYTCPLDSFNPYDQYEATYIEFIDISLKPEGMSLTELEQTRLDSLEQELMQQEDRLDRIQCKSDRGSIIEIWPVAKSPV